MLTFRRAAIEDTDFIVEAIIEADKSGSDILSYTTLFSLNEKQVFDVLKKAVVEDITGQELCLSGFMIAEINGNYAGAACSWIEEAEGIPSQILKANVLAYVLGKECIASAQEKLMILEDLYIKREAGALQIESVYICNKYRGLGVSQKLITELIKHNLLTGNTFKKIQIQLSDNNFPAIKAYRKTGFEIKESRKSNHQDILKILPSNGRIMMEADVDNIIKKGFI